MAARAVNLRPYRAFLFLLLLFPASGMDAGPPARVVAVHDGDTLTALLEQRQIRVRLLDIDAPELGQPFGTRSKQSLSELCFGKRAALEVRSQDRYGRTLAHVVCAGKDANTEQVRRGYAWAYTRYAAPDSPLHGLEREARAARRGLWEDPEPIAPWDWRRNGRRSTVEESPQRFVILPQPPIMPQP